MRALCPCACTTSVPAQGCEVGDMIYFTAVMHICAVLICISFLAYVFRTSLVEILPVFVCVQVLVLYALAVMHRLSWIDGVEGVAAAAVLIWFVSRAKQTRRACISQCLHNMAQPSFITAVFLLVAVAVCTSSKVVTWWDDINFWAADVKSLYYLNGFAGKYANVAPEFGDYPPAAQLIKWWFLHWDPHEFRESLAFVGYYTMNLVFLFPILRRMKDRNIPVMLLMAAALWLFPGIAEVYGYAGFCADLTMACVYGGFLLAVTDREAVTEFFYYGRLALYLGVLVLIKSIGFVWALFGLVFLAFYRRGELKKRAFVFTAAMPVLTGGSWMLFCLIFRRVAKTTSTAVKYLTTNEYSLSGYKNEFAAAFIRAFVSAPMHKETSIAVDLTPLGLYLCIILIIVLMLKCGVLSPKEGKTVLIFSLVSGTIIYAVIFVAHITVFAMETQYLEASGMISSIERYGAPFSVGTLFLLAGIWVDRADSVFASGKMPAFVRRYGAYLSVVLFVALTAGYRAGYDGLIGYRHDTDAAMAQRAAMIGQNEEAFLGVLRDIDADRDIAGNPGGRILYIRKENEPRWVNNSYLSYEASPVPVVYRSVALADAPAEWMVQEIRDSHTLYLYVEEGAAQNEDVLNAVFGGMMQDGDFSCGVLYFVSDDGTEMKLTPVP